MKNSTGQHLTMFLSIIIVGWGREVLTLEVISSKVSGLWLFLSVGNDKKIHVLDGNLLEELQCPGWDISGPRLERCYTIDFLLACLMNWQWIPAWSSWNDWSKGFSALNPDCHTNPMRREEARGSIACKPCTALSNSTNKL